MTDTATRSVARGPAVAAGDGSARRGFDLETRARSGDHLELRFWLRLLTCTTLIEREIKTRLDRTFGITLSRFDVLAQLERADEGLTMGQLSARMMVTHGNVTGLVDRLVRDGLVDRRPVEGNRRATLVRLTRAGRVAFERMAKVHHGWVCSMLDEMDRRDLAQVFELLSRVKRSVLHEIGTEADGSVREDQG